MHRWLRNTHLVLGLLAFPMLLVYGVSSIQMAHGKWFSSKPAVTETELSIPPSPADDARAIARELMARRAVRGELQQVRQSESGFQFLIVRPGTVYQVAYSRQTGKAKIRTNVAGFVGMLNRIHHVAGLWHEYSLVNVWGALVGIASTALILLGLTGIYLWFQYHNERKIGACLLALSLGYSLTLMVLIRTA